jgi:hypothetical protein
MRLSRKGFTSPRGTCSTLTSSSSSIKRIQMACSMTSPVWLAVPEHLFMSLPQTRFVHSFSPPPPHSSSSSPCQRVLLSAGFSILRTVTSSTALGESNCRPFPLSHLSLGWVSVERPFLPSSIVSLKYKAMHSSFFSSRKKPPTCAWQRTGSTRSIRVLSSQPKDNQTLPHDSSFERSPPSPAPPPDRPPHLSRFETNCRSLSLRWSIAIPMGSRSSLSTALVPKG